MDQTYVTDTHGLLWFLAGSPRLSDVAREVFRAGRDGQTVIFVPVIAVAEVLWVIRANRVEANFSEILAAIQSNYSVVPLVLEDVAHLPELPDQLEMHDRMIVWEAMKRQATLITCDEIIRAANVVPTLW